MISSRNQVRSRPLLLFEAPFAILPTRFGPAGALARGPRVNWVSNIKFSLGFHGISFPLVQRETKSLSFTRLALDGRYRGEGVHFKIMAFNALHRSIDGSACLPGTNGVGLRLPFGCPTWQPLRSHDHLGREGTVLAVRPKPIRS